MSQVKELIQEELVDITKKEYEIILFNDDVNTFDYVIDLLIKVCGHTPEQAEQCALITHYNGKCSIKKGKKEVLTPICGVLLDKGLSVEIK